jgi:hypothetical protein
MQRTIVALAAAALAAAAMPSPAQARCHGCGVGAGIIGGLAAGALIGSAIANSQPRYGEPAPVYGPPPAYAVEPPDYVDGPVCHLENRQLWDGEAYRTRRIEVCD